MLKFCSTLKSRSLLPPSTRPVPGSWGPMLRMSYPRTEYSPPRKIFWKIGRSFEFVNEWMYSVSARKPSDIRLFCFQYQIPSRDGRSEEHTSELQSQSNIVC